MGERNEALPKGEKKGRVKKTSSTNGDVGQKVYKPLKKKKKKKKN